MKRLLLIVVFCMATLSGCQWDPPHDNPLDPGSNAYHFPFGTLKVSVLTLIEQPIRDATVLLPELGQIAVTDTNGHVEFKELPIGTWWVVAYRNNAGSAVYTSDSAQVTIQTKASSQQTLLLDGLPEILSAYVFSVAYMDTNQQPDPFYSIRLKSTVLDPDGVHHLQRVEAVLIDSLHDYTLNIGLQYNADSAFWWQDIPADSFRNSSTDNALFLPFTFLAFDAVGKSSPPRTAFVARVIHSIPRIENPPTEPRPLLQWTFDYLNEFKDISAFNYHVIIYRDVPPLEVAYSRILIPKNREGNEHKVEEQLPFGDNYKWEVLVLDNFGNSSRSLRGKLTVGITN